MNKIKEWLNKWKDIPYSWIEGPILSSSQFLSLKTPCNSNKNPSELLYEYWQIDSKGEAKDPE